MRPCGAIGSAPRFERGGCRFKPCRGLVFYFFRANRLRSPTGRGGGFKPRPVQVRILPRPFHERRGVGDRAERYRAAWVRIPHAPPLTGSRSPIGRGSGLRCRPVQVRILPGSFSCAHRRAIVRLRSPIGRGGGPRCRLVRVRIPPGPLKFLSKGVPMQARNPRPRKPVVVRRPRALVTERNNQIRRLSHGQAPQASRHPARPPPGLS